jgi:hypothetical protein
MKPKLTVFTVPKPFQGHIGMIQDNAIGSWVRMGTHVEVLLFGDEDGVAGAAERHGVRWIGNVRKNAYGTPVLSDVFTSASKLAQGDYLVYTNADILFCQDLAELVKAVEAKDFFLSGCRTNLDVNSPLVFSAGWQDRFAELVRQEGERAGPDAGDYFVFPRRSRMVELPDFAVGRPGWDNWMFMAAIAKRVPFANVSDHVLAVHQNHGYGHVAAAYGKKWEGPEGDENKRLAGAFRIFTLDDATHRLENGRLRRIWKSYRIDRFILDLPHTHAAYPIRRRLYYLAWTPVLFGRWMRRLLRGQVAQQA